MESNDAQFFIKKEKFFLQEKLQFLSDMKQILIKNESN
jgi:hypothetical protein